MLDLSVVGDVIRSVKKHFRVQGSSPNLSKPQAVKPFIFLDDVENKGQIAMGEINGDKYAIRITFLKRRELD